MVYYMGINFSITAGYRYDPLSKKYSSTLMGLIGRAGNALAKAISLTVII